MRLERAEPQAHAEIGVQLDGLLPLWPVGQLLREAERGGRAGGGAGTADRRDVPVPLRTAHTDTRPTGWQCAPRHGQLPKGACAGPP